MDMHEDQPHTVEGGAHTKSDVTPDSATAKKIEQAGPSGNLVPKIHMSTQLFNGDYLVQTVNQNTPSMQPSPYNSRVVLPSQYITDQPLPLTSQISAQKS